MLQQGGCQGASPKGCPDPTLLPAGIPSFGKRIWARAVVLQHGCASGKDFASCSGFPGQLNMLCSQPRGLGRFIKASMYPNSPDCYRAEKIFIWYPCGAKHGDVLGQVGQSRESWGGNGSMPSWNPPARASSHLAWVLPAANSFSMHGCLGTRGWG